MLVVAASHGAVAMMMAFSFVVLLAVTTLSATIFLRQGRRWRVAIAEGLRILIVSIALFMLWQPETSFLEPPTTKRKLVLLVDRSASMQTTDVPAGSEVISRQQAVDQILADASWQQLDDRFERVVESFSGDDGGGSDLAWAIEQAGRRHGQDLAALVLLSDGDWNVGRSPVEAAARWSLNTPVTVPCDTRPIGSPSRLPDLELISADVPTFGVAGKPVRIPFAVQNWMPDAGDLQVVLEVDGATVSEQRLQVAAGQRLDAALTWRPEKAAEYALTLKVAADPRERITSNNQWTKVIDVREEKLNVLVIETRPRWEYRYLRNALVRDTGIEVSCLLLHPELGDVGGGGTGYLSAMPQGPEALASYDVVILGDIGVGPGQLTDSECRDIVGLVQQQASGLVLMPGQHGFQDTLLDTALGDLYPVILDRSKPRGIGSEIPGKYVLTNEGRRSLLTELSDDAETNWTIWESLPGFQWWAAVQRPRAGSEVLAVKSQEDQPSDATDDRGRTPVLVTRRSGAGKVLFMGTDSAWRWRLGVEDKYHYRFWGQVIRWMAYQRNMSVGQSMRMSYHPERPVPGELVSLRAAAMSERGEPVTADTLPLEVIHPDGSRRSHELRNVDTQWGAFVGEVRFPERGSYRLRLNNPDDGSTLETRLEVQGRAVEPIGRPARTDVMQAIAEVGRGQMLATGTVRDWIDRFNGLPLEAERIRRIQWWNHPAMLGAMFLALGGFWIARKWAGLI
ncbi:hypothetical protein FYK55_08975 [Roseiconus nitratireducens]|uniref:CARDB domain-containing protein n=1 Tax=Roseiconus nitratireducens TaxID=2605748 RepID=A0A5M6DAQ4_9BACT|nr:CARDB domain-containing protein [Roseiconus nitratireducens]KAA5544453.1 hypothetical protein FYK55_08975 [Roseiconus nitratireducens]